jgi:hypothetical protein
MGTFVNPMTQNHALEVLSINREEVAQQMLAKYKEENPECKQEINFNGLDPEHIMMVSVKLSLTLLI